MPTPFRPMLAASLLPPNAEHTDENILSAMSKLHYPVMVTTKKDGIRAVRANGSLLSRRLKKIPNTFLRKRASMVLPGGYDMELWAKDLSYCQIESIVMSKVHSVELNLQFHVLDTFKIEDATYEQRVWHIQKDVKGWSECPFEFECPTYIWGADALMAVFLKSEEDGAEGICFRTPDSPYKYGRSTLKEQYLVKLSRYVRTELTVVGFKEQVENANPESFDSRGLMDRSSMKDFQVPKNTLGAFVCKDKDGGEVDVGTGVGLTDVIRKQIWSNREAYVGKTIVVKHKPVGMKDKLRHPIYMGWRKEEDI